MSERNFSHVGVPSARGQSFTQGRRRRRWKTEFGAKNEFFTVVLCCLLGAVAAAQQPPAERLSNATKWHSQEPSEPHAGSWSPLILTSADEIRVPPPPANLDVKTIEELAVVRSAVRNPSAQQRSITCKWSSANQGAVWRRLADELVLHSGMGAPSMLRVYAALHIAMADATLAAWNNQNYYLRPRPSQMDPSIRPLAPEPQNSAYPSDRAAAAGAAERILSYFFPRFDDRVSALADESVSAQVQGGLNYRATSTWGENWGEK